MSSDSSSGPSVGRRGFLRQTGTLAATAALTPALDLVAEDSAQGLSVALVGCGHVHTGQYVRQLKERADVKVKYVWDHVAIRAQGPAKALNAQIIADPKTVWSDPEVKAAVICSETNLHHELVLAAAAAHQHVYAEKPLGINARESYEMADSLEGGKCLFNTGYFMRGQPPNLFLRDHAAKGTFGKITRVRAATCHNGSLEHWFDNPDIRWMADPKIAGVGAFGDLGTHSLDLLLWMFGPVNSVAAEIKTVTGYYGDCDESGEALLNFDSGAIGCLEAGWVDVDNPITMMVSGTEGYAWVERGRLFVKSKNLPKADGQSPWTDLPTAWPPPLYQFLDAIQGKDAGSLVTAREAAARVSVMEAAYNAARDRAWTKPA